MRRDEDRFWFGAGRPCLDLVATVRGRLGEAPFDRLTGPAAADLWLTAAGFVLKAPAGQDDLAELRALREAVFRLLCTLGERAPAEEVRRVNRWAAEPFAPAQLRVGPDGAIVREAVPTGVGEVLSLLAGDAVGLLSGSDRDLLRQCAADSCGTFFLGTSRGKARQWCSSATCGNRARVSAYRRRHEADPAGR